MGFIKNIIAGIVSFITRLFSKKGDSYYLELKEEANVTPAPAPASATATATVVPKAAPVAAKVTKAEPVKPVKIAVPTETNFATKYLIPTNNPRRRPGVNMSTFLDMARQVKTPG
jgi:hypothetical protein